MIVIDMRVKSRNRIRHMLWRQGPRAVYNTSHVLFGVGE